MALWRSLILEERKHFAVQSSFQLMSREDPNPSLLGQTRLLVHPGVQVPEAWRRLLSNYCFAKLVVFQIRKA